MSRTMAHASGVRFGRLPGLPYGVPHGEEPDRSRGMLASMPRFIILEHTGAPDDPTGRHFDLLLEQAAACRTWRLLELPFPGGPAVAALELPAHRLAWLDIEESEVSGGRGRVRRVAAGSYEVLTADAATPEAATSLVLRVQGDRFGGRVRLEAVAAGWAASLSD